MKFLVATVLAACAMGLMNIQACAADDDDKTSTAEMFKLPDPPTTKALIEYCKKLIAFQPKDQAEVDDIKTKVSTSLKKACEHILTLEKGDQTPDGHYAKRLMLIVKMHDAGDPAKPEWRAAVDEMSKFLTDPKYTAEDVELAMQLGETALERVDKKKAGEFYLTLSALYAKNEDPQIQEVGRRFAGSGRRLSLIGNPIELKGTKLDGKAFDVSEFKGKVVLVDMWATWCPVCVEEIPHVKKAYEGYHEKGFEVVAVSADKEKSAVTDFVAKRHLNWINLYDNEGNNPAMEYYGIQFLPTTILVGKDGNVVSLEARGEELTKLLKNLLGDPIPPRELPKAEEAKPNPLTNAILDAAKELK